MGFLWILLYALTAFVFRRVDSSGHFPVLLEPWAMLLYSGSLLIWLQKSGRQKYVRLESVRLPKRWGSFLWALLLIPGCNVLLGKGPMLSVPVFAAALASAVTEEVFFRGFLLRWMEERWPKGCIFAAAGIFALFHLMNIPSAGVPDTVLQILCAFGAGLGYCGAAVCCGSLLVPIGAHFLVNLTGWGWPITEMTDTAAAVLLLCAAAAGMAGVRMHRTYKDTVNKGEETNGILH